MSPSPQLLGEHFPPADIRFQVFVITGFLVPFDHTDSLVLKHLLRICISIMQGKRVAHSSATAYPGPVPAHARHGKGCRPPLLHLNYHPGPFTEGSRKAPGSVDKHLKDVQSFVC